MRCCEKSFRKPKPLKRSSPVSSFSFASAMMFLLSEGSWKTIVDLSVREKRKKQQHDYQYGLALMLGDCQREPTDLCTEQAKRGHDRHAGSSTRRLLYQPMMNSNSEGKKPGCDSQFSSDMAK